MPSMSESFVDLSYRGLSLGKRIKLTQVRPSTGFVEMPTPMPVGTTIGIATDDGVLLEATVAEVREQVSGSERAPGMLLRPKLDADAGHSWWTQRVTLPELEKAAPQADAGGKVTVVSHREHSELADDGRNTAVMSRHDDAVPAHMPSRTTNPGIAAPPPDQQGVKRDTDPAIELPLDSGPVLVDDGKRTMAMSAVDLEALGLDPSTSGTMRAFQSGEMPVLDGGAAPDDDSDASPDDKSGGKPKKKRRRR